MSDVENEIKSRVDAFVNELSDLVRQAALEAVAAALKKGDVPTPTRKVGRPSKASAPVEAAEDKKSGTRARGRPAAAKGAKRRAGEKRSPQILAQVTEQVFNHIKT